MLTLFAAIVALTCAAACTRRLYIATNPISFHPAIWLDRVKSGRGDRVARAVAKFPNAQWERDLVAAIGEPDATVREGLINEQIFELDFLAGRWSRVPRVCASVASSSGLLFGSLILRMGLVSLNDLEGDARDAAMSVVIMQAVSVAVIGVAGATFAIAAQYQSRKAARAFQRDAEALVDFLERKMQGSRVEE